MLGSSAPSTSRSSTARSTTSPGNTSRSSVVESVAAAPGVLDAVAAGDALVDGLAALGSAAETLPCRVEDADLWFAETPNELERAKGLCQSCPVRELCFGAAVARREPWGVWGGSIFDQGVVIARKRPRGRPRKQSRDVVAA